MLIDTGWSRSAPAIRMALASVAGSGVRPRAILLTHIHPDHSGSALELARSWGLRLLVHPDEVVLARGGVLPRYANPLDRRVIAPVLRLVPRRRLDAMIARSSLEGDVEVSREPAACAPPRISTWDWAAATSSVAVLADLRPAVLATGHGHPITGVAASAGLESLAASL